MHSLMRGPSPAHASCAQAEPLYIAVFISSMAFPALASILKEKIFGDAKEKLGGKDLDIFVVNSFGSREPVYSPRAACAVCTRAPCGRSPVRAVYLSARPCGCCLALSS